MKTSIKVNGINAVSARLSKNIPAVLEKTLKVEAQELQLYMRGRFRVGQNGANTDDTPFAPLAESTLENIANKKGGGKKGAAAVAKHRTLIGQGRMFDSLYAVATKTGIRVGSDVEYLSYHVFGTKHMPRRSVVPILLRGSGVVKENRGSGAKWWLEFKSAITKVLT